MYLNSRGHRSSLNSRVATHEEESFECREEENLAISTLLSLLAQGTPRTRVFVSGTEPCNLVIVWG